MDFFGPLTGTSAFRLMPTDDLVAGDSAAECTREAAGFAWQLRYDWVHPQDGLQSGVLLVGGADEEGVVRASWIDSWHQKPGLAELTGSIAGDGVELAMTYAGDWGWQIAVQTAEDALTMTMHNVLPESMGDAAGAYLVMDARWTRA